MRISLAGERQLGDRYIGFNTPVMWEMPFEDPKAWPLFEGLRSGLLRFPGGMIANFWNWRTGRVELPEHYIGSFKAGATDAVRHHPMGSSYEDFVDVASKWGSEVALVLNIDSADVADQVAWIKHLAEQGLHPTRIELGNEFYFYRFFGDPSGRFDTVEKTLARSKKYVDAVRPHLPDDARFAILSSGSLYEGHGGGKASNPFEEHLAAWDEGLVDADWFDAVVVHTYPEIIGILNPGWTMAGMMGQTRAALKGGKTTVAMTESEEEAQHAMTSLLARVEEGTKRQVEFLEDKLPGKEIWWTEWGVGENASYYRGENPVVSGLWIHVLARQIQEFLKYPAITMALNHSLYFDGRIWSAMRPVESEEHYKAIGAYDVFRWFGEALDVAHGVITVSDAFIDGAQSIVKTSPANESYTDVTATVIDASSGKRTAIVHNTSTKEISVDLANLAEGAPAVAEVIHTPLLRQTYAYGTPDITAIDAGPLARLAPNSLARFVWMP